MDKRLLFNFVKQRSLVLMCVVLLAFNGTTYGQCSTGVNITLDETAITFDAYTANACFINIPYTISNFNVCDYTGFTFVIETVSPEGENNVVEIINANIPGQGNITGLVTFPSVNFYDDQANDCFDPSEIEVDYVISVYDSPEPLIEEIDCPFGNGVVIVCSNDNSIICDDRFCDPFPCSTNVGVRIDQANVQIVESQYSECTIEIPYALTSSGTCDVMPFDIDITVTSIEGTETVTQTINGIAAGSNVPGMLSLSSPFFETATDCYDLSELDIQASISSVVEAETSIIDCPYGSGTIEVCSNNNYIVCDESNCVAWTCDTNIQFNIDDDDFLVFSSGVNACTFSLQYSAINFGDCDVDGFDVQLVITTPEGSMNFSDTFGGLTAGSSASSTLTGSSTILHEGGSVCYDISEITIEASIMDSNLPEPITTIVNCPDGTGTLVVCTNNTQIVCDDTNCSFVLPVEMAALAGSVVEDAIILEWITLTEINNDKFSIEHSSNGREFKEIGVLDGKGNSYEHVDYQFMHYEPVSGSNYYRVSQIDYEGKVSFSNVIHVKYEVQEISLKVYPNPVHDKLTIAFNQPFNNATELSIYDGTGRLIRQQSLAAYANSISIATSDFEPGMYYVRSVTNGKILTKKFLKL